MLNMLTFRSSMCSALRLNWCVSGGVPAERIPDDFPFAWARKTLERYLQIRECYYGDFYPITSYSKAADGWMACQLDRPDLGNGVVIVLRRPDSPYESARFPLRGPDPAGRYRVRDIDGKRPEATRAGKQLLTEGLRVQVEDRPGSAVVLYQRQ